MSGGEYMRTVTDAGEWLWGMIQGGFNEQQTISQIIVDAIIGMIPVVGDVTAVRDLLAVIIRLADQPEKRDDPLQWIELVICLLALIPVAGGAIKGVGRLLVRVGGDVAQHSRILREAIELLNRVGSGDAVRFIRELDLTRYTGELQRHFRSLVGRITTTIDAVLRRGRWLLGSETINRLRQLKEAMQRLVALGDRMIPDAVRDLNAKLRTIQRHMYQGTYHEIPSSLRVESREFERGLLRERRLPDPGSLPHPPASLANYTPEPGWPDISTGFHSPAGDEYKSIRSFSGRIAPDTLPEGTKIYRVIDKASAKAGGFWTLTKPPSGRAWRDEYAVLESWNKDRFYIEYTIPKPPPGKDGLRSWKGTVASQVERNAAEEATYGQMLVGGAEQHLIDLYDPINDWARAQVENLPMILTGWTDHLNVNVPSEHTRGVLLGREVRAERVGDITAVTRVTGAAVRGAAAEDREAEQQ